LLTKSRFSIIYHCIMRNIMEIQTRYNFETNVLSFNDLPNEILTHIFKKVQYARDLVSLATVNKLFNCIFKSLLPQDYARMIPIYMINSKDPGFRQLPGWKKVQLAVTIEKKFISSDPLQLIFQKNDLQGSLIYEDPLPKILVGDYFVFLSKTKADITSGTVEV